MFFGFIPFLLLFSPNLYATSQCGLNLGNNEEQPTILKELTKLNLAALEAEDRISAILLKNSFEKKLEETALRLGILKEELRKKLLNVQEVDDINIQKPTQSNSTFKQIPIKEIHEIFLKNYSDYNELRKKAQKLFNELALPTVNTTRSNKIKIKIDTNAAIDIENAKIYILILILQNEFAKEINVKLLEPIYIDFNNFTGLDIGNKPLIILAIFKEDKPLVKILQLLGAEIPGKIDIQMDNKSDEHFVYSLMVAYFLHVSNPKIDFVRFLVEEIGINLNTAGIDDPASMLYSALSVLSMTSRDFYQIHLFDRDETNTIKIYEYFYSINPSLFTELPPPLVQSIISSADDHYFDKSIEWLTKHGIDINIKNNSGFTLLHNAVKYQNFQQAKLLLGFGANKNIMDNLGKRPVDYAKGNQRLMNLLKD